jgi:hypothetical protein
MGFSGALFFVTAAVFSTAGTARLVLVPGVLAAAWLSDGDAASGSTSSGTAGATGGAPIGPDRAGGRPPPRIAFNGLPRDPTKKPARPPATTLAPSTEAAIVQTNRRLPCLAAGSSGDFAHVGTDSFSLAGRLTTVPRDGA